MSESETTSPQAHLGAPALASDRQIELMKNFWSRYGSAPHVRKLNASLLKKDFLSLIARLESAEARIPAPQSNMRVTDEMVEAGSHIAGGTAQAIAGWLEAALSQVSFTLSDASRLMRKEDVQGACPHPDDCFYEGGPVRCGPCAVKASAAKGIEINDRHSHLPEVARLRREMKAAQSRIAELEARTTPKTMELGK